LVLLVDLRIYTFPLDIRALQNDAEIGWFEDFVG
jgi:hypothetical protein